VRVVLAAALALVGLLGGSNVFACADPEAVPSPQRYVTRILADEQAMAAALQARRELSAQPAPEGGLDRVRLQLQLAALDLQYRRAARDEQKAVYDLASYEELEPAVLAQLPAALAANLKEEVEALHALYRLAGYDEFYLVHARFRWNYDLAEPSPNLMGYYREAQQRYGVHWSYLASLNYIESDFGRVLGPSSAGALGPMQFLPSTWAQYGQGGDIMNPHDSILAAARMLLRNGAPKHMGDAIFAYNHDWDYVEAVVRFANVMARDPGWVDRIYYWSTLG